MIARNQYTHGGDDDKDDRSFVREYLYRALFFYLSLFLRSNQLFTTASYSCLYYIDPTFGESFDGMKFDSRA